MAPLRRFLLRLYNFLRPGRAERELARELTAHLTLLEDELRRQGMSPEEARLAAQRASGGIEQTKELHRDARSFLWLEDLRRDVWHAVRSLSRNLGFTSVVVFTLALGIGATTVVFSVIDSFFLNPAPFRDPDRLAEIWIWSERGGGPMQPSSMLRHWRDQTQIFEQVEGHWESSFTVTGDDEPWTVWGSQVTVELFRFLGVGPRLGRDFVSDESDARVAIISHGLWRRRFGGDVTAVGKTLRLNDEVYTIVGVMPATFRFPVGRIELWIPFDPLRPNPLSPRGGFTPIVRLRSDVPIEQADAQVSVLAPQLDDSLTARPGTTARLQTLYRYATTSLVGRSSWITDTRTALFLIFGAAGLVLIASCTNAANLFLSRALSRGHEIAVRAALGGGRWRLLRHLLTEAALVVALAGVLGLLMAHWTIRGLAAIMPVDIVDGSLNPVDLDARAAAWSVLASLLAGLLAATIPALRTVRGDIAVPLKGHSEGRMSGHVAFRGLLVSMETALAVVLLIGAGLTARSLWMLQNAETGWSDEGVVVIEPQFSGDRYRPVQSRADLFHGVLDSFTAHPEVKSAAIAEGVPLHAPAFWYGVLEADTSRIPDAEVTNLRVSEDFFTALGIQIEQGRTFTAAEQAAEDVAVVSDSIARQLWPGETPIGKRFRFEGSREFLTVVGVARDVQMQPFDRPRDPMEIYRPLNSPAGPASMGNQYRYAVVRTDAPQALIPLLKRRAWEVDANLPLEVRSLHDIRRGTLAGPEFHTSLLIGFGVLALMLTGAGVYAVVAYETRRRTQEISIRVALGATPGEVVWHVMGRSMRLASVGVAVGVAAAFALTRLMSSMLFEVQPTDPVAFLSATLFLMLTAALAAYLPAHRATKVDPLVGLRYE